MKRLMLGSALGVLLMTGGVGLAKGPKQNVSGARHPNIAAAQKFCAQAFEKVTAAQKANEYDMEGHAAKAKELLEQASNELKLAAEAANKNK